ncbi:Tn7-like transposition protein A [Janthinobacterium sp. Marseille]|nr:TnsA endonuclease N-terminal domain-containing protein [Janthinobacterium sp. Marseille]ABR91811.1 Tn7-like transposition protein A [Janthinobacterium sp. Marseille]
MRTQKRFTPNLLDRYTSVGRGHGVYETYIPWHRVGRSDPASEGRSHLQLWEGRQRELLSDKEWVGLLFSTMLPSVVDIREQIPLSHGNSTSELFAYLFNPLASESPGTLQLAKQLGIKHPKVHGNGRSADWVMTTDLLLTLKLVTGEIELLAVAIKINKEIDNNRTRELLAIERQYWLERGIPWLLITPSMYDELVADTLRRCMPWVLGIPADPVVIDFVIANQKEWSGRSLTYVLERLSNVFNDIDLAQRAFWQAVCSGRLPVDLRRGWRPHEPITLLSDTAFWNLNPIASRRSAWVF